ncbi:uncharacterized protein LOC143077361 [Mytilus galloprovincialis]|uniref:uncharacterized protein LOC143077361 n=1 Tax=Mytilus galloprovincialis TaxID=29158 RepID=UPI003F7CCEF4
MAGKGILDSIKRLEEMAEPVINDKRQQKYCEYISLFLSHFGQERCMLAGSTKENTRLRLKGDEGDFDYLIISEISIPIECLEYRKNLPCFVYINGSTLKNLFPGVELIDGKYLPSDLLGEIRPEAFKHSRNIHTIVTQMDSTRGQNTLHVSLDHKIKPGLSLVHYADPKCPDLSMVQNKQKKDIRLIKQNVEKILQGDSPEIKKKIKKTVIAINNVVQLWEKSTKTSISKNTIFHQTYDLFIEALTNGEDQTSPRHPKKQKLDASGDDTTSCNLPSTSAQSGGLNKKRYREEVRGNDDHDQVTIQYDYKTSKDFIPVFPIKGKPKYLDEWQNRQRNWPPTNVVRDIYNSEFFVVAKPALVEPSKDMDFCLACNIGEIKLAEAMTQLQRNVILIIKSLQKSTLRDYTEILTTFHWKTVVYWVSEKTETQILENRTKDNILKFLQSVLEYMVDCLCKNDLQHYFVPSNLFAGKDEKETHDIILKISEIQENPIANLNNFFKRQSTEEIHVDIVSMSKIKEFEEMQSDPGENGIVESVISLLRGIVIENKEVMKRALTDVLTESLPFLIEEVKRGDNLKHMDSSSLSFIDNLVVDFFRIPMIDKVVSMLLSTEPDVQAIADKYLLQFKKT